jgi:hypothetical protein
MTVHPTNGVDEGDGIRGDENVVQTHQNSKYLF